MLNNGKERARKRKCVPYQFNQAVVRVQVAVDDAHGMKVGLRKNKNKRYTLQARRSRGMSVIELWNTLLPGVCDFPALWHNCDASVCQNHFVVPILPTSILRERASHEYQQQQYTTSGPRHFVKYFC